MDSLNPVLLLVFGLRKSIENGESLRRGLQKFAAGDGDLQQFSRRWMNFRENGGDHMGLLKDLRSPYRRAVFLLVERGFQGEPIHGLLIDTEKEIERACLEEIDRHLAVLPFRLMVPLLLMLFPAMMILILAPFLDLLAQSFTQ